MVPEEGEEPRVSVGTADRADAGGNVSHVTFWTWVQDAQGTFRLRRQETAQVLSGPRALGRGRGEAGDLVISCLPTGRGDAQESWYITLLRLAGIWCTQSSGMCRLGGKTLGCWALSLSLRTWDSDVFQRGRCVTKVSGSFDTVAGRSWGSMTW